ncbi:YjbH domain-containing protein [Acetonema longum]|uniref:Uncharacterized protein n=1 Tax=Acetonema longum DSM 6540 TaxID=1009370 RepID=F7NM17_9FIRM|nr:YjbH domain-containing protein [Acetonema longum]EGO62943.1 hypothetical protein ALO_15717 [Acetonema longum DSM 6540]
MLTKKIFAIIVSFCFLTMAASTVLAAPSLNGPTGMIHTPTADVPQAFSAGIYHLDEAKTGTLNMTLLPRLEVGATRWNPDLGDDTTAFHAKWGFMPETAMTPGLAVGVEDIGDEYERSPYIVASKALPLGFRVHAGTGGGRFKDKVFASLETTINPVGVVTGDSVFPATTLIAEYDGEDTNFAVRLSILPGLKAEAGWRGLDDSSYYGLSFTY